MVPHEKGRDGHSQVSLCQQSLRRKEPSLLTVLRDERVVLAIFIRVQVYSEFQSVPSMSSRGNLSPGRYDGFAVTTVGLFQPSS